MLSLKFLPLGVLLTLACGGPPKPRSQLEKPSAIAQGAGAPPAKQNQVGTPAETPDVAANTSASDPSARHDPTAAPDPKLALERTAAQQQLPTSAPVLHIGDSFAGALGYELNKAFKEQGVKGILKYEKATYIPTWAWNKELPQYLARYQPGLVLITLGGNELAIPDPNARAKTVQRLVKRLNGTPCVWIGIPIWEGANPALMDVIRANVSPCLFFDSHALIPDMRRAKDKIHPSLSARTEWAGRVVEWLKKRLVQGSTDWAFKAD